jgi:hypothetical protein
MTTKLLDAEILVMPVENLLATNAGRLGGRLNGSLFFFAADIRRDFSVIAKDLLPAHTWGTLAKTGRWWPASTKAQEHEAEERRERPTESR